MSSPQPHRFSAKLTNESYTFVKDMVRRRGFSATSRVLGTSLPTLDKVLASGLPPATRDRLEARVRALQSPVAAGELVCTAAECGCSGTRLECDCVPDRPEDDRVCKNCHAPLREPAE